MEVVWPVPRELTPQAVAAVWRALQVARFVIQLEQLARPVILQMDLRWLQAYASV